MHLDIENKNVFDENHCKHCAQLYGHPTSQTSSYRYLIHIPQLHAHTPKWSTTVVHITVKGKKWDINKTTIRIMTFDLPHKAHTRMKSISPITLYANLQFNNVRLCTHVPRWSYYISTMRSVDKKTWPVKESQKQVVLLSNTITFSIKITTRWI